MVQKWQHLLPQPCSVFEMAKKKRLSREQYPVHPQSLASSVAKETTSSIWLPASAPHDPEFDSVQHVGAVYIKQLQIVLRREVARMLLHGKSRLQ